MRDIIRDIKIEIEDTSLAHSYASKSYLADSISKNIKTLINQTILGAWSTSIHRRTSRIEAFKVTGITEIYFWDSCMSSAAKCKASSFRNLPLCAN